MTDHVPANMTIALVAGGTGGHIFPALAVARELARRGVTPVFLTDDRGEAYLRDVDDMQILVLSAADPRGGTARALVQMPRAVNEAVKVLGKIGPQAVIGFGGYATLAVMIAARIKGVATCLHEQNAILGRVNRLMARFVGAVALTYENTARLPASAASRSRVTGNPVRSSITENLALSSASQKRDRDFRLLVIGGSQGAMIFSQIVPIALGLLPSPFRERLHLTQQCRPETLQEVTAMCHETGIEADLSPFFDDMDQRLAAADLVIGRSGASTISEIEISGCPAILVPLPYAMDDHQTANVQPLLQDGAAWLIPQPEFTAQLLATRLQALMENPDQLQAAGQAMQARARPDAAMRVADLVAKLAQRSGESALFDQPEDDAPHHIHSSWALGGMV
jgi:UDP-N-acetylglucosamine--N-acetylmuramyl-(pentapeptide) pyrophosphoryl-undecaprenol N-acetylglucosamine transferase